MHFETKNNIKKISQIFEKEDCEKLEKAKNIGNFIEIVKERLLENPERSEGIFQSISALFETDIGIGSEEKERQLFYIDVITIGAIEHCFRLRRE
jgi:hypothetical protein